ncbi:Aspartyl/glutamyl-trna, partial [Globisporangium splendens]
MMRQTLLRNARALGAHATFATRPHGHVHAASEWCRKSLLEASMALQEGRVTAVQLTQACIDQIDATSKLNMFVWTDSAKALELAKESDARRAAGRARGSLDGIPIGVKDLFCMENVPTTAASKILEGARFVAPYESTATAKLLEQGAIPLGKLNMDEFAMGSGTLYTKFGATINPWSSDLDEKAVVAGGSSGGSAAAVASGCCFAALGSDTGGSVRQCNETIESSMSSSDIDLSGVRVGIPHEYFVRELPEEILAVWDKGVEWLRAAAYYIIACAEASSNLSRYDGVRYGYRAKNIELEKQGDQSDALHDLYCRTRSEGFGEEVQRRILSGTFVLSAGAMSDYYERAVILRQKIRDDFQNAFKNQGIDVLMTPTTPSGPFAVHNKQVREDPVCMYLNDVMTIPANMAGVPAISIPASLTSGGEFPLSLQLMGARKTEEKVLQVANALERHAQFLSLIPESVFEARR